MALEHLGVDTDKLIPRGTSACETLDLFHRQLGSGFFDDRSAPPIECANLVEKLILCQLS